MGSSIGAAARNCGTRVHWASEGRSDATCARAAADGLDDLGSLRALVEQCPVILSVCPPAEAVRMAGDVLERGFSGIYVDANAIAPVTARQIARSVEATGASFVDGGIIGPPARSGGQTYLHLSGSRAKTVADLFAGGVVETRIHAGGAGAASALKMTFAAYTKGSSALLLAVRALARAEGIESGLLEQWQTTHPQAARLSEGTARATAPKAWRFAGEMDEIAATFEAAGLPDGFHRAAAELYARMAGLKDIPDASLDAVLERLLARH
jgi:3-hydroxyisobutyrate dehydrogenase-like beta-hydroxyacid dehydrogenase